MLSVMSRKPPSVLEELSNEVNTSVSGFNHTLTAVGKTLKNGHPQSVDIVENIEILGTHIETIQKLKNRVNDMFVENEEQRISSTVRVGYLACKMIRIEYASDILALALSMINSTMKTMDLTSDSPLGWAALALLGTSQILSKIGDRIQSRELSQQNTRAQLRDMEVRLSVLDRAHTMVELFTFFKELLNAEKKDDLSLIDKGIKQCKKISEDNGYLDPKEAITQIFALSNPDLKNLSPETEIGKNIVRIIEPKKLDGNLIHLKKQDSLASIGSVDIGTLDAESLLTNWNTACYEVEKAFDAVSSMVKKGEGVHFNVTLEILEKQVELLKKLHKQAGVLTAADKNTACCSHQKRLLALSIVETLIVIATGIAFVLFNETNPRNLLAVWISGVVIVFGPLLSKSNKATIEREIDKQADFELLILVGKEASFIKSIETFSTTLSLTQETRNQLTDEQIQKFLQNFKSSLPFEPVEDKNSLKAIRKTVKNSARPHSSRYSCCSKLGVQSDTGYRVGERFDSKDNREEKADNFDDVTLLEPTSFKRDISGSDRSSEQELLDLFVHQVEEVVQHGVSPETAARRFSISLTPPSRGVSEKFPLNIDDIV